jgi:hypothetical protein
VGRPDTKRIAFILSPILPAATVVAFTGMDVDRGAAFLVLNASSLANAVALWFMLISALRIPVATGVPALVAPVIMFLPPAVVGPIVAIGAQEFFPAWLVLVWNLAGMYFAFVGVWFLVLTVYISVTVGGEGPELPPENHDT